MSGNIYWLLFSIIAPLSLMAVGGGQAVVPEIHRQIVDVHHFLNEGQFIADFAISRLAPGPGSLLLTLIGWDVAGWKGALVATVAIFVPSSVLVVIVARIWARSHGAAWQKSVERGLAPIATGLIMASVFTIARSLPGGWLSWVVGLISTVVMLRTKISPLWMIGMGAVIFIFLGG